MRLRSLLFVPGDSERKFARAKDCGADALILDLEDSVAPSEKANARAHVARLIEPVAKRAWACIVRVNALDTGLTLDDLAAVVKPGLDALLIPKVNGAADLERIGFYLDALEAKAGMAAGSVKLASRRDRNRKGDVRAWLVRAGASPPDRLDLGRGGPLGGARRDRQQGAGRIVDLSVSAGSRAVPVRRVRRRSHGHRYDLRGFSRFRGPRAGLPALPARRFRRAPGDPSRSGRHNQPTVMRHPKPRSRMRARSSPRSTRIRARARSAWTARWSTFRI